MKKKPSPAMRALKICAMIVPWLCSICIFCRSVQPITAQDLPLYAVSQEEVPEGEIEDTAGTAEETWGSLAQAETEEAVTETAAVTGTFLTEITAPDLYMQQIDGLIPEWGIINEGVDDSVMAACGETLSILPEWVKTKFALSGWEFAVTMEDINAVYLNSRYDTETVRVMGAASYGIKKIVISATEEAVSSAPLHEFGHWCDWVTSDEIGGFSSQSGDFERICQEEAEEFVSVFDPGSVDTGSRQELCADLFKYYWLEPELLAQDCPGMYGWMDALVAELHGIQF